MSERVEQWNENYWYAIKNLMMFLTKLDIKEKGQHALAPIPAQRGAHQELDDGD